MPDNNNQALENLCKELSNAFKETLTWEWDSRFGTILANFDVENKGTIQEILERYIGIAWNDSNVSKASHIVQLVLMLSPVKRSPFSNALESLACNSSNSERKMETRRLSF